MQTSKRLAVFIMVHGRPENNWTYDTLRKCGYKGDIYLVGDDQDHTINDYRKKYPKELIVFDKEEARKLVDAGDNSGDLRSTLYSSSKIHEIAKQMKYEYFFIMCDDYTNIRYRFTDRDEYVTDKYVGNLDALFSAMITFMENAKQITCLALAQAGDFIGGTGSAIAQDMTLRRKAMNTFLCSTNRPFKFMGRMNEDVTTYINLGSKGLLFYTTPQIAIDQKATQSEEGGLTELYKAYGTYVKSFFSVMYNPSSVKISMMGTSNARIHHKILWKYAVPKLLSPEIKKS